MDDVRKFFRIMSGIVGLIDEIASDEFILFAGVFFFVEEDRRLLFFFVFFEDFFTDFPVIDEDIIDRFFSGVLLDHIDEVFHAEVIRLTVLRHDVADIDDLRTSLTECLTHAVSEEIWDDTRIEIARSEDDVVTIDDDLASLRVDVIFSHDKCFAYRYRGIMLRLVDICLSDDSLSILELDTELDVLRRHGDDFPLDIEHVG